MTPISSGTRMIRIVVYLIDTVVVSELRKRNKANSGVLEFFDRVRADNIPCYLSVITVGELL